MYINSCIVLIKKKKKKKSLTILRTLIFLCNWQVPVLIVRQLTGRHRKLYNLSINDWIRLEACLATSNKI